MLNLCRRPELNSTDYNQATKSIFLKMEGFFSQTWSEGKYRKDQNETACVNILVPVPTRSLNNVDSLDLLAEGVCGTPTVKVALAVTAGDQTFLQPCDGYTNHAKEWLLILEMKVGPKSYLCF